MTTSAKRATVYFDPYIHKALKLKSIETSKTISELVNEAVKGALSEDAEDIAAFEERANEPLIVFPEMLKRSATEKMFIAKRISGVALRARRDRNGQTCGG
jgi:hypothetical protein